MTKLSKQEKALLWRLPFYIEHKLLKQRLEGEPAWQMIPTDFTWQALCRYYALALKGHPLGWDRADAKALRQWLATGNRLEYFQYPRCWEYDGIASLRDPRSVVSEFDGFIDGFAGTVNASAPVKMIPLTGFTRHMKKKRSALLKLTKIIGVEKWPLLMLDDGVSQSGYYDDHEDCTIMGEDIFADSRTPTLMNHPTLDTNGVRREIWRRWQFAWRWKQPLDILTEDEKRFNGSEYMAVLVEQFLSDWGEAVEILTAVLAWHHGRDRIVAAVAEVIKLREASDPTGTQNKLEKLPAPVKLLLLPHGIWAI